MWPRPDRKKKDIYPRNMQERNRVPSLAGRSTPSPGRDKFVRFLPTTPIPMATQPVSLVDTSISIKTCPEGAIPASRAKRHAVRADTKAANPVLMTCEHANTLTAKCIPDIAGPIVVATEEDAARDREGDGSYAAEDVVVRECVQLAICPDIKQTAGGIVGSCCEGITVGEEADRHRQDLER